MRALIVAIVLLASPAAADTIWQIDYLVRGDLSHFYGPGSYQFLLTSDGIPVYDRPANNWHFLGFYDEVTLPASLPLISFPSGIDLIVASPAGTSRVPEPTPLVLLLAGGIVFAFFRWTHVFGGQAGKSLRAGNS